MQKSSRHYIREHFVSVSEIEHDIVSKRIAGICIALNYWGKHKRKMAIRGIKLTGKQPAAPELPRRVHSTDIRLHYHYIQGYHRSNTKNKDGYGKFDFIT